MRTIALIIVLSATLVACKGKKEVAQNNLGSNDTPVENTLTIDESDESEPIQVIYYERTVCFGTCPSFIFTMKSDGSATYEGRNFVDLIGKYDGESSPIEIAEVMQVAKQCGYDTLQTAYDNPMVMDLPSTITVIGDKEVLNRYKGPDLETLYAKLDQVISEINWVKIQE